MKENHKAPADRPASRRPESPAPRRSRSHWLLVLVIAVPVMLLGVVAVRGMDRPEPTVGDGAGAAGQGATVDDVARGGPAQVGEQAPTFSVTTLSGNTFQVPAAKPTILTFVNLCPTCIEDTRRVGALQERFGDVAVLAVASDPTADSVRMEDFIRQAGNPDFELALDPQSTLTQRFDAFSMAANVLVVDPTGRITYRGPVEEQAMAAALVEAGARG